jgi:hypothetical protein
LRIALRRGCAWKEVDGSAQRPTDCNSASNGKRSIFPTQATIVRKNLHDFSPISGGASIATRQLKIG